jgi:hypothetical protein
MLVVPLGNCPACPFLPHLVKGNVRFLTMFVDGSGQNEQSLERTFHRCFLPNFTSFGRAVSEEKIKW